MNEELETAKNQLLEKFEELLTLPLIVKALQHDTDECPYTDCDKCELVDDVEYLEEALKQLRHRELVEQTIETAKVRGTAQ